MTTPCPNGEVGEREERMSDSISDASVEHNISQSYTQVKKRGNCTES